MKDDGRATSVRLMVVDDHRAFAEALAARLGALDVVDDVVVAFSADEATKKAKAFGPDLILLDLALGEESGLDVLKVVHASNPDVAVVMVSGTDSMPELVETLSQGARGWIPKDVSEREFLAAIDDVMLGRMWLPPKMISSVLETLLAHGATSPMVSSFIDNLTPREREVLDKLALGMSRGDIADTMHVSPNTVRTHIQSLLKKAGVHSTLAALAKARDVGYVPGSPGD
jgi:DNA-binding NarL/FixJ family response regulator